MGTVFYVVKAGKHYLRFGSYRTASYVPTPFKATTYARQEDAEKRVNGRIWAGGALVFGDIRVVKVIVNEWDEEDV